MNDSNRNARDLGKITDLQKLFSKKDLDDIERIHAAEDIEEEAQYEEERTGLPVPIEEATGTWTETDTSAYVRSYLDSWSPVPSKYCMYVTDVDWTATYEEAAIDSELKTVLITALNHEAFNEFRLFLASRLETYIQYRTHQITVAHRERLERGAWHVGSWELAVHEILSDLRNIESAEIQSGCE